MNGIKFRRQQSLGPYVLDFYCNEHRLAVELDGGQHYEADQMASDRARTEWLETKGVRVLRFTNREVLSETTRVLEQILAEIEDNPDPSPQPSP